MKFRIINLIILILPLVIGVAAQTVNRTQFSNLNNKAVPLFVFTYIDPWRDVYGSDMPEFVLYEDGTVIFNKCREKDNPYSCDFYMSKLSSEEVSQTLNKLNPESFYSFDDSYSPDSSTITVSDLSSRLLVMRKPDGTYKKVSTYGGLSGDKKGYVAENVPIALREIVEFAGSYDNSNNMGVDFEYYEVVIKPHIDDSKKNFKWSKGLSGLKDPRTIKHTKYGRYSLFVHRSYEKQIARIFNKLRKSQVNENKAALLINNQRWKAEIRLPFPSEEIWLRNFRD